MGREFDIRKEVVLPATPEQVWRAIATPEGREAWLFPSELTTGATVEETPPGRLAIRTAAELDGSFHAFEYLITGRDDGSTVLRFVHSGIASDDWGDEFVAMTGHGWDMYLHTLREYLVHFADRPASYIEAEAPPSVSGVEGWALVERALGLTGPVAEGDRVRLAPPGLPPIDGVVDYRPAGEDFLGIRGSDAMYRFHGRGRLGMPVAVGHHLYGDGVDRDAARNAWQTWLTELGTP